MFFLYPAFLWASLIICIPVIIHFIRFFKIKSVHFPDIQLLKEIQKEKKSVKNIVRWLILLFRILFILFLVLTFAMPFKKKDTALNPHESENTIHVFLIDNSLSMLNENAGGNLLEQSKKWAEKIMDKLPSGSKFLVADASGKLLNSKPSGIKKSKEIIRQILPVNQSLSIDEWIQKVYEKTSSDHQNMVYYIFSDFQKNTEIKEIQDSLRSIARMYCYPLLGNIRRNAFFDTAFISKPVLRANEKAELSVRISNPTDEKLENVLLRLELGKNELAIQTVSMEPQSHLTIPIPFTMKENGYVSGKISMEDNGLFFDNHFFVTISSYPYIEVSIIHGQNLKDTALIPSIFRTDSIFKVQTYSEKNVLWDRISKASLIILNEIGQYTPGMNEMISKLVSAGKYLVFIPKAGPDNLISYPEILKSKFTFVKYDTASIEITPPDAANPYFLGVFEKDKKDWKMPVIKFKYEPNKPFYSLWKLKNGDAFFAKTITENNKEIYFFTCPLNSAENSFLKHPAAVPFFLNMGFLSAGQSPVFYRPDKRNSIYIPITENIQPLKLSTTEESEEKKFFIIDPISEPGGVKFYPFHYIKENGTYAVWNQTNKLMEFSVNSPSRESELNFINDETSFKKIFPRLKKSTIYWNISIMSGDASENKVFEGITHKSLWKWMLVCAIFCIFMEILLHVYYAKLT
jgi:hypothetical protein